MKHRKMRNIGCILLLVIIFLLCAGCSKDHQKQAGNHPFDFYIDLTTKEDIEGLSAEPFVEGVFPFTLMIF